MLYLEKGFIVIIDIFFVNGAQLKFVTQSIIVLVTSLHKMPQSHCELILGGGGKFV